ncbi:hypothetical protein ACP70R_028626 [Stipagrostis hirtigluma subsp. patula]
MKRPNQVVRILSKMMHNDIMASRYLPQPIYDWKSNIYCIVRRVTNNPEYVENHAFPYLDKKTKMYHRDA